jgi:nucleotide-binding universal stress UspA family protein
MKTQHILAPVDGSEMSHFALREADGLASRNGGTLTLMFVHAPATVHLMDDDFPEPAEITEALLAKARKIMEKWARSLKTPEADLRIVIERCCSPAEAIVEHSGNHDLIVMSTHGHTGLKHVQLGSVAERVVRGAHCDVFVVKQPGGTPG